MIIPTAEPFFFPGNEIGCLLVHGFTGTPKEMRWMGEYLAEQGYSVHGVRLAGHATKMEDLKREIWQDWVASVEDGYHLLRGNCKVVFVIGLSMGGVLALYFATQFPVSGVVAMSTPYKLPSDPRSRLQRPLSKIIRTIAKGPPDWHNQDAAEDHIDYPAYPTKGIIQLDALLAKFRRTLCDVKVPVLLIHSHKDQGVAPENLNHIYDALGSKEKSTLWLENSGHVITREPERETVFRTVAEFIEQYAVHIL